MDPYIAKRATSSTGSSSRRSLVGFRLGQSHFACDLTQVGAATRMVAITPVPEAPDTVLGVVDWHSQLLPVVDIRSSLTGHQTPPRLNDRLLILRGHNRRVMVVVDEVTDVITVEADALEPPPAPLDQSPLLSAMLRTGDALLWVLRADVLVPADLGAALEDAAHLRELIATYLGDAAPPSEAVTRP